VSTLTAYYFDFMPFSSRKGESVVGIRVKYDARFTEAIKAALQRERQCLKRALGPSYNNPGGWLPDQKLWFVEAPSFMQVTRDTQAYWKAAPRQNYDTLAFVETERPPNVKHYEPEGTAQVNIADLIARPLPGIKVVPITAPVIYGEWVKMPPDIKHEEVTEQATQPAVTRLRARHTSPKSEDVLNDVMLRDL